jgi:D-arabinitol 2-dehydrogenase
MFQRSLTRALRGPSLRSVAGVPTAAIHSAPARLKSKTTDAHAPAAAGEYARTDESIEVKYPADHELPSSKPVQGAGMGDVNVLPTLATFSLKDKVAVVTGGARGLGLVMGQGLVISGANLAIVDLNKEEAEKQAKSIVETFKRDSPDAKRSVLAPRSRGRWDHITD